mmetsp:Transcript_8820/g.17660  ORF Transcript_8820/g.17660 Transcript_8820/m.17660 type:complete len:249 (+) Transcript_8820:654-1400(+)
MQVAEPPRLPSLQADSVGKAEYGHLEPLGQSMGKLLQGLSAVPKRPFQLFVRTHVQRGHVDHRGAVRQPQQLFNKLVVVSLARCDGLFLVPVSPVVDRGIDDDQAGAVNPCVGVDDVRGCILCASRGLGKVVHCHVVPDVPQVHLEAAHPGFAGRLPIERHRAAQDGDLEGLAGSKPQGKLPESPPCPSVSGRLRGELEVGSILQWVHLFPRAPQRVLQGHLLCGDVILEALGPSIAGLWSGLQRLRF